MAYYSNQGVDIHQGAAGLLPLTAYKDGSLGGTVRLVKGKKYLLRGTYQGHPGWVHLRNTMSRSSTFEDPRLLERKASTFRMSFEAGKNTKMKLPNPQRDFRITSITPLKGTGETAMLQAYKDGSLGTYGLLQSYKDGSLGMPLFLESGGELKQLEEPVSIHHGTVGAYGELQAYRDGSLGEYFTGVGGCHGCGQVDPAMLTAATAANEQAVQAASQIAPFAGGPVLDLSDPAVLQEFKLALAVAPWTIAHTAGSAAAETEKDLATPFWTTFTTQLVDSWITGMPIGKDRTPESQFAELDPLFPLPHRVPADAVGVALVGITAIGMTTVTPPIVPPGSFPNLQQYLTEVSAAGKGTVLPPKFKSGGANGMLLAFGIAGAALVGMAVMGKKKRR